MEARGKRHVTAVAARARSPCPTPLTLASRRLCAGRRMAAYPIFTALCLSGSAALDGNGKVTIGGGEVMDVPPSLRLRCLELTSEVELIRGLPGGVRGGRCRSVDQQTDRRRAADRRGCGLFNYRESRRLANCASVMKQRAGRGAVSRRVGPNGCGFSPCSAASRGTEVRVSRPTSGERSCDSRIPPPSDPAALLYT